MEPQTSHHCHGEPIASILDDSNGQRELLGPSHQTSTDGSVQRRETAETPHRFRVGSTAKTYQPKGQNRELKGRAKALDCREPRTRPGRRATTQQGPRFQTQENALRGSVYTGLGQGLLTVENARAGPIPGQGQAYLHQLFHDQIGGLQGVVERTQGC